MRVTQPKRGRRGAKRLDLSDMRHVFRDTRLWCAMGIVKAPAGGERFTATSEDVIVEVILQPSLQDVTCRLSAAIWNIPNEGEEVLVVLPEGALDFMPIVLAVLSTGSVPSTQGPAANTIVIQRDQVLIHTGAGGAAALPTKASVDSLRDSVDSLRTYVLAQFAPTGGHTHVVANATPAGPGPVVTAAITPIGAPPSAIPTITGTTCLKAK